MNGYPSFYPRIALVASSPERLGRESRMSAAAIHYFIVYNSLKIKNTLKTLEINQIDTALQYGYIITSIIFMDVITLPCSQIQRALN